jgi:hypothetical protein
VPNHRIGIELLFSIFLAGDFVYYQCLIGPFTLHFSDAGENLKFKTTLIGFYSNSAIRSLCEQCHLWGLVAPIYFAQIQVVTMVQP